MSTAESAEMGRNASRFLKLVKKAGNDAASASAPVQFLYGDVTGVDPIKIQINDQIELTEKQLELTESVRNHKFEVNFEFSTDSAAGPISHSHGVKGPQTITIFAALEVGDKVLLARWQGGQKFIVIDAIKRIRERS